MAEEKNSEKDINLDEQIILKEGELTKDEVSAKKKINSNLNLNFSMPDPKIILAEQKKKLQEKFGKYKDKILYYGLSAISLIIVLTIILMFVNRDKPEDLNLEHDENLDLNSKALFHNPTDNPVKVSQVENLVQKANLLYETGDKREALKLYGRIATYNASLSYYNLGVARLKKGMYKKAINAFDRAIQNREHITPSAINGAVCSQKMNNPEQMKAYLDLAYKHLPEELDSPLYSYYYSLISFYKGKYFETFSSLKHRTSDFFNDEKNMMESRINLLFENYGGSVTSLEKSLTQKDKGNLGLIYANMGELELAKTNLQSAIENMKPQTSENVELMKLKYAKALVSLKLGDVKDSGLNIMAINDMYEKKLDESYQLRLFLKESIFDVQKAQKFFHKEREFVKYNNYQILFYFASYKIFDAKKSINLIRKGSANLAMGDSDSATNYLESGAKSSDVNKNIILAVKEALNKRLRTANRILREIQKENPKHAVLHYDLALTYAQLGDMKSANKHFKRSFHLNARDYMSGIFSLLTGDLIGADLRKLEDVLKENLSLENDSEKIKEYEALLYLRENNYRGIQKWLDTNPDISRDNLFELGFGYLITTILDTDYENQKRNKKIAKKILGKLPNDIFAHLIYLYSNYHDLDIKEFSKEIIHHFQVHRLPLYDFYYGARITQEMFIKFNLLTGQLERLQTKLNRYYKVELKNPEGIVQALALTKLYNRNYEGAYRLYNKLIDDFQVKDSRTLFLAGVSAIASKHYANAVALFELAKLRNKMNLETRYALGLLYLDSKNFSAGGIQFKRFGGEKFYSDFFDFNVEIPEKIE